MLSYVIIIGIWFLQNKVRRILSADSSSRDFANIEANFVFVVLAQIMDEQSKKTSTLTAQ